MENFRCISISRSAYFLELCGFRMQLLDRHWYAHLANALNEPSSPVDIPVRHISGQCGVRYQHVLPRWMVGCLPWPGAGRRTHASWWSPSGICFIQCWWQCSMVVLLASTCLNDKQLGLSNQCWTVFIVEPPRKQAYIYYYISTCVCVTFFEC